MSDLPKSISAARKAGEKLYYTGKPCNKGHDSPRMAISGNCVECQREYMRARYAADPEKVKKESKLWAEANKEHDARLRRLRKKLPRYRALQDNYRRNNKGRYTAQVRARQLRTARAMPPWVDTKDLVPIYEQARRLSDIIGTDYAVDHIVPITHDLVCGLHVPWNLQIIPAWQNFTKSNKFEAG
jgi:hypothetical protein